MNTTCDLNIDWNRCAYCSELRDRVQSASDLRLACSQRLDQAWDEYRSERERGVVSFGTVTHRAWQARIDNLDRQLRDAADAAGEAIDEWAACIHEHHRRYEARQQKAEGGESAETEEMAAIRKDAAVDALVNIYGGHIDKWLEALRERTGTQTDADWAACIHEHHRRYEARQQKAEGGESAETEEMAAIRKDAAVDALVNIYGGHIDKWLEALRERTGTQTDADTEPTAAERDAYFAARDHADDADAPGAPGRRAAVRIVAYDVHKGGCHEVDPTDVPVWLLDTPNTAIARDVRQATLQEIRTLINDLIDGPGERGEGES